MKYGIVIYLMLIASATAQPAEPDEATKVWALKRAYQLNGNSMVGWDSIDLSNERPVQATPSATPGAASEAVPREAVGRSGERSRNICTYHHLRKVFTADGNSWRCRK